LGQYDELDRIASELNDKQLRYTDGVWKLGSFFEAVNSPWKTEDPEGWKELFQRLEEWDGHSHNVFSGNAIGCAKLYFAWQLLLHIDHRPATEAEQRELAGVLASAAATYDRVLRNPQKCIDVYAQLIRLGHLQRWPEEKMMATMREAISVVPDYYPCFIKFAMRTLPNFGGNKGDTRRFFDSIPTLLREDRAYDVYVQTCIGIHRFYEGEYFGADGIVEWLPMKKGFERMRHDHPKSAVVKNEFAVYAVLAGDRPTARLLLEEIMAKKDIDYEAWLLAGGFEKAKKWILESP